MSEESTDGGAGPALGSNSKDASTHAASLCGEAHALCESARTMVREQPLLAVSIGAVIGVLFGTLLATAPRR